MASIQALISRNASSQIRFSESAICLWPWLLNKEVLCDCPGWLQSLPTGLRFQTQGCYLPAARFCPNVEKKVKVLGTTLWKIRTVSQQEIRNSVSSSCSRKGWEMKEETVVANVLEWSLMTGFCVFLLKVDVFGVLTQLVAMVL